MSFLLLSPFPVLYKSPPFSDIFRFFRRILVFHPFSSIVFGRCSTFSSVFLFYSSPSASCILHLSVVRLTSVLCPDTIRFLPSSNMLIIPDILVPYIVFPPQSFSMPEVPLSLSPPPLSLYFLLINTRSSPSY